MDCVCITKVSLRGISSGKFRAKNTFSFNASSSCVIYSKVRQATGHLVGVSSNPKAYCKLKPKNNHNINLFGLKAQNNFSIKSKYLFSGVFRAQLKSSPNINISYTDKLGGSFDFPKYLNFKALEKVYPTTDIVINSGDNYFVNQLLSTTNLYSNIDEGILSPAYDNKTTFIQPSSIKTEGTFKYQFGTSNLRLRPRESLLLIRASAPLSDYSSEISPVYKLKNIYLEDPSGNLVIKYKDFNIRGDADYNTNYVNFSTYISEPEINNSQLNTWEDSYPVFSSGSPSNLYKLNIDFEVECVGYQFTDGYDLGYQSGCTLPFLYGQDNDDYLSLNGAPLSTQAQAGSFGINNSLRITAIELCNSGELFTYNSKYIPLCTEVSSTGLRLTRKIYPDKVLQYNFDNDIYPDSESSWRYIDDNTISYDNNSQQNEDILSNPLRNVAGSIKLLYSSISDSGKLQLRFAHDPPEHTFDYQDGEFSFSTNTQNNAFSMAKWSKISHDHFFVIDKIDLKVVAKKSVGSRDYYLDVVGYSDDKLLNITSSIGGFLQNDSGVSVIGNIPTLSGLNPTNELSIAGEPLSQKSQYFASNTTNNAGGDHYLLTNTPLINSTSFQEYTIPLKIYKDNVTLGESTDYSMSSYFEKLFLDIYPIPSGAEISRLYLVVHYKPSNAFSLHTIGQPSNAELQRREPHIIPNGDAINASGSIISNIPHGYTRDNTFKSNYSTRWKGVTGNVVAGPFDPLKFDFSFENQEMTTPFLNGYFSFNNDIKISPTALPLGGESYDCIIVPNYSFDSKHLSCALSGIYVGNYSKVSNLGLRFKSQSLFNNSTEYTTLDWTRTAGYSNHELYGKLTDNFEHAVRVSGSYGRILIGNYAGSSPINTASGFAIYTRFSPDINMSGVGYNLWNSGIIFSNSAFSVGFSGGKLFGSCFDSSNNLISIHDDKYYYEYEYPLPVMLSYNESDNKLRLYSNNLIGQSNGFIAKSTPAPLTLVFGNSINGFLTDIGISTLIGPSGHPLNSGINILSSGTLNKRLKQDLYSNLHKNLHTFIDDDIKSWHIGDFKICMFNQSYDRFTSRIGSDFIVHNISNSGLPYAQTTDLLLPSSVNYNTSYHTQIENDSLRFNLSDTSSLSSPFYFADSRISKTLPRGYQFEKEAIAVDTILQHETYNNIVWNDNNVGPQLIVSLYTPNKEPSTYPTVNYGLVTRDTHYLKPSGCWQKITSIFDFNNLLDKSETWRAFNENQYIKEFNHNYFSKDIDDMFLQYDLVYPSGSPFKSSLKIHSANVRLKNAFVANSGSLNNLNLYNSGQAIRFESLNLSTPYTFDTINNALNLSISGKPVDSGNSSLNLYISGVLLSNGSMPLHSITIGSLNNLGNNFGSEEGSNFGFNLYCSGQLFTQQRLPLFTANSVIDQSTTSQISLFAYNKIPVNDNIDSLNLYSRGFDSTSFVYRSSLNLYTEVTNVSELNSSTNLFLQTFDVLPNLRSGICSLFTVNVPILNVQLGNQAISWDSKNVGVNIRVDDNNYASLRANDEIRGVDLMCYGECK